MRSLANIDVTLLQTPERLSEPSGWSGHIPFAMWLVSHLKPRLLVELGTHTGNSYFSFCQSVQFNGLTTQCFAVDTWRGDSHAGYYGDEVYLDVARYNEEHYSSFSQLLRMTFDEAVSRFDNGSIDLLHIDGFHTYEAVEHDFYAWLPKLSERAVVLFHDINVYERGFGVWRLWEELTAKYPHLAFKHSHGLGVLVVGREQPRPFLDLLDTCQGEKDHSRIQKLFERMGFGLGLQIENERLRSRLQQHNVKTAELSLALVELKAVKEAFSSQMATAREQLSAAVEECNAAVLANARAQEELLAAEEKIDSALMERDAALRENGVAEAQREAAIAERDKAMEDRRMALARMEASAAKLDRLLHSNSWRVTAPLRALRRSMLTNPSHALYRSTSASAGVLWRRLPMSVPTRMAVKGALFRRMPRLFEKTGAYQRWLTVTSAEEEVPMPIVEEVEASQVARADTQKSAPWPVPRLDSEPLVDAPVRLIAFYLPQFHSIPENDEWWGEGFTEWTNVRPARSQYEGHYQPHEPGELGYYNLLDGEVMSKQVELAKLYGLGGFCFYFYWFGGKRLLEAPILNYLANRDLDLPFCLCWANENWSRRWDGLDEDILIGQQHSELDDIAFIEYVSKYLMDDRYIRIDGKPLLLVYRPSLLPSARKTTIRWRNWCRQNGVGEIYLAYTQSFDAVDPKAYGFDAAVEFPPNIMAPPPVAGEVEGVSSSFHGQIFDWRVFPQRSEKYRTPRYKLFRGVNPSWDNTARKKTRGTILYGSSPHGYQQWLYNACTETVKRLKNPDERLVFVNAWNEWAEGAHLEPDKKYGYAYLEATRLALLRAAPKRHAITCKAGELAIVVHAFYADVLIEMFGYIENITLPFKLFVTTPVEKADVVRWLLDKAGVDYLLIPLANRGRDVLPFLKIMPFVEKAGYEVILKLHTKKSTHRNDGVLWRNDVYNKLLNTDTAKRVVALLGDSSDVGIVGPEGHLVPMDTYWGANKDAVLGLAARMGLALGQVMQQHFVAGTMFYARTSALQPLLNLAISKDDFEPEEGQLDGTLAHAIERAIALSALAMNEKVISTDAMGSESMEATVTEKYGFASVSGLV